MLARQFPQYGVSLLLVFAMRMAAMFVLTTTNLGRLSGILPKWFVVMGFAVAIGLLFTASFSSWLVFVFPAWILVFSAILVDRARKISPDLVVADPGELQRSSTSADPDVGDEVVCWPRSLPAADHSRRAVVNTPFGACR